MLNKKELKNFIKFATSNRNELEKDSKCGCYYCGTIFSPKEITQWIEDRDGDTAVCPYCSVDSVVGESCGYQINKELLDQLYTYWFRKIF